MAHRQQRLCILTAAIMTMACYHLIPIDPRGDAAQDGGADAYDLGAETATDVSTSDVTDVTVADASEVAMSDVPFAPDTTTVDAVRDGRSDTPSADTALDVSDAGADVMVLDVPPDLSRDASCLPGMMPCGSRCVDVNVDVLNCGVCGGTCPIGGRCEAGVCIDAIHLSPSFSHRFMVEAFQGGTWSASRDISRAEAFDMTLLVGAYAGLDGSGRRTWPISRVGLQFPRAIPPAGSRIVAARIEMRAETWHDITSQVLHLIAFHPTGAIAVAEDMELSHWMMGASFGSEPNATFSDRVLHAIVLNGAGMSYLTGGGTWLGIVSHYDREDITPPIPVMYASYGIWIQPSSLELVVSYTYR